MWHSGEIGQPMSRVLLINMPFSNLGWPSLGLSLLKAELASRNIPCDVAYFNFDLAELLGLDHYHWIADQFAFVHGGERLFAKHFFADRLPADADYFQDVLLATDSELTDADNAAYLDTARCIEPFLEKCMASIDWSRYSVVGFSTTFQQTIASLCLARRIKQSHPQITTVFGGSACEGCVGEELLRQFSEIDYVFTGEADRTFPSSVEQWFRKGIPPKNTANARERLVQSEPNCLTHLDELPFPDFDDYFARLQKSPLSNEIQPLIFHETSRGCWWGQKHQCVFCGLNGSRRIFRTKSAERAVDELRHLVYRYGVRRFCAADNILDLHYFDSFLPMVKNSGLGIQFSYEMKTNLTRRHVEMLRDAGMASAQLGIESFSSPLLHRIDKGATALQNLQTLRWLSETGMDVKWNLLYGFPGEEPEEYAQMAKLLPSLYHLAAPLGVGRVRVNRFAPYFDHAERYGIINVRPQQALRFVYPFSQDVLARLAYNFDFDFADGRNPLDYAQPLLDAAHQWQHLAGAVMLRYLDRADGILLLTDTRPGAQAFQYRLSGIDRTIYLFCDAGRTLRQILEHLKQEYGNDAPDESTVAQTLGHWVSDRLMALLDGHYLSLATRAPAT